MFVRFSETRDLVHRTAHGLTPQQLQYRPDASRWSVAENLEHVTIVSIGGRGQVALPVKSNHCASKLPTPTYHEQFAEFDTI
jgi:hypothetical protein